MEIENENGSSSNAEESDRAETSQAQETESNK